MGQDNEKGGTEHGVAGSIFFKPLYKLKSPKPCPGLEAALLAVAEAAPEELGQLFECLEPKVKTFIRTALLALHRVFPKAPGHVQLAILCAALERHDIETQ